MKRTWRDAVLEVACNKFMSIPYGETSCFNPIMFMQGIKYCRMVNSNENIKARRFTLVEDVK